MKLFILGAGKPIHGNKPSALKHISAHTTVLDWKIYSFEEFVKLKDMHFLGGYHLNEVIEAYPELNFSIIPNWQEKNILHTLLKAPFGSDEAIISYSDTIFRKTVIEKVLSKNADVAYGVDSTWKDRFSSRSPEDIAKAEAIFINNIEVEFTGLVYFSKKAIEAISSLNTSDIGSNLLDLLAYLQNSDLTIQEVDIEGEWAELNSSDDIAKFILGTKAETLARLEPLVKNSHISKQVSFTSLQWKENSKHILTQIFNTFPKQNLVVRSSSKGEDNWGSSNAGGFQSILNVDIANKDATITAIEDVIKSYGNSKATEDQVLVQAFLSSVKLSGVIFTCGLESGSPYYRINFDDVTQSTESVTGGTRGDLRTIIISRLDTSALHSIEPLLIPVLKAVEEIEKLLVFDKLDIEFAIDKTGQVHIFQVRPITVNHIKYDLEIETIAKSLLDSKQYFLQRQKLSPFLFGKNTILANMPDWNPAEIIGTRPKPLAFSLYREIITNDIWAKQRAEFGYCDVRPFALMASLSGQPYVDTRASFNSFIPNNLTETLKSKLANAYIEILFNNPTLHDKIEFDIVFSIWTPGFLDRAKQRLSPYGINKEDINEFAIALKDITKKAFLRLNSDISSISLLEKRRQEVLESNLSSLDKAYILLNDCKEYGTLAFSHAARAGFIATTFLNSFAENNFLSQARKQEFLMSFRTVAGNFEEDKYLFSIGKLSLEELTHKYGHLRPGTYEIKSKAYWENPKKYLVPENSKKPKELKPFILTPEENKDIQKVLNKLGSSLSTDTLMHYFADAIQAREFVKFEFTKNLSKALDLIIQVGKELDIKRSKLSYLEFSDLEQLKLNITSLKQVKKNIKKRKKVFAVTQVIELPPLIKSASDIYCFERYSSEPNFVTTKRIDALVLRFNDDSNLDMRGKIVMIPQADPGYDWLFGHDIAGLITQYGGANSHMAIRAAEVGLPSAIGVGEKLYEKIAMMRRVELNCSSKTIREIT